MLSRLVTVFLPRSKCLLISWLQSPSSVILEPKKIVFHCFHCFSIWHGVMGQDDMIFVFWMLSFRPAFLLSCFTFIKSLWFLFAFCHKGGVICISEVIDISPSNLDSSLWFIKSGILHDVLCIEVKYAEWQYTALTYSVLNLEPVYCFMSSSNYCFLTCIQISQEAGQVVWYSHLLKNFPQFVVIHIVKGFGVVSKAEVDVLWELSVFRWSTGCWQFDLWFLYLFTQHSQKKK